MSVRYETESSIWVVNEDSMIVTRMPKSENPSHPFASYDDVGRPEPVKSVEVINVADAFCLNVVYPDGRWARSGAILQSVDV